MSPRCATCKTPASVCWWQHHNCPPILCARTAAEPELRRQVEAWSESGSVPGQGGEPDPALVKAINKVAACLDRDSPCGCVGKPAVCRRDGRPKAFDDCRRCLGV